MGLTNYWWLIIWLIAGGGFLAFVFPKHYETVNGKREVRWGIIPALVMVLPYIIWAGFRDDTYGDTYVYRTSFKAIPENIGELATYLDTISKDKGFTVVSAFIKYIFGNSDVTYFLVIAAIQLICLTLVYRKFSCNLWMSVFIFIASDYMSWCHNGIRQFFAIALILLSTNLLLKKNYVAVLLIVLAASTIHASALLMIPIFLIVQGKAWNKKTLVCILLGALALVYAEQFTDILDNALSNTQYSNMVTDWEEWQDDGTNPIRVLIYSIPMLFSIVGINKIREKDDPLINMLTNFSILTAVISLIAMVTSGIFIGRLIMYPAVYSSFLLLPWEVENLFNKSLSNIVKVSLVIGYIGLFYYQMHVAWGLM